MKGVAQRDLNVMVLRHFVYLPLHRQTQNRRQVVSRLVSERVTVWDKSVIINFLCSNISVVI